VATAAKRNRKREPLEPSHVDQVDSALRGGQISSGSEELVDSWRRSKLEYHVDPGSLSPPNILTESELRVSKETVERVILHAQEELDRLYAVFRDAGYVILLCNADGIAIHHRGNQSDADRFKYWGIWAGGVWSEGVEGTNGIGTAITEQRPVVVHRGQHYRARHLQLSCSAAPIFDAYGNLVSVLDSSSFNSEASDRSHEFALTATRVSARAIEERLFRQTFSDAWTIAAAPFDESRPPLLLAVDKDRRVIGADRVARSVFGLDDERLADGVHLSALYSHQSTIIGHNNGQDIAARLVEPDGSREWRALITPPASGLRELLSDSGLYLRPRISLLSDIPTAETSTSNRGGLAPRLVQRLREYIELRLGESISLNEMAESAGLSVFHFTRAFGQSFGMPPHRYLLHRRISQAQRLLRETDLSLSEIALSTGFSDQSHFARHFRRVTGLTPTAARWKRR